jgi:nickel transport protein
VLFLSICVWFCAVRPVAAHDLRHTVENGEATVVVLYYADGKPFSYESYEVFRPGEETPFQVGRTDAAGRVVFIPDRSGRWRIRAFSEDGHGVDFETQTGPSEHVEARTGGGAGTTVQRIVVGVSVIFGIFGVIVLFWRRAA